MTGRTAEALPLVEQAVAQAAAMNLKVHRALVVASLSEVQLRAGNLKAAHDHAVGALELCQSHQEEGQCAWTLYLLGDIAAQGVPLEADRAEDYYQQSHALADRLDMRPLQAHCHLGLGILYTQLGKTEAAHQALTAAMALYRSMEMRFWLSRAQAALG